MASNNTKMKIGRDAGTGQFKTVEQARRDKQGSVVESIRRPGWKPSSPSKKK